MLKNNIEKLFLLFLFISIGVASFSQETEYKIDYLHDTIKTHKTVAILPFNISISYQGFPRNTNDFINTSQEVRLGDYLQSEMFTYLSQRNSNYSVTFQNIDTTNTLLRKANLIFKDDKITKTLICKLLKVDAIILCSCNFVKTLNRKESLSSRLSEKIRSGDFAMQVEGGNTGMLLWRLSNKMNKKTFSSVNYIIEDIMKLVGTNFPYEK